MDSDHEISSQDTIILERNLGEFEQKQLILCFRLEAKNGLLSDLNFKKFINIAYSCANKHQFWMASKESELKENNSLTYTDDLCEMTRNTVIESTHYSTLKPKKYIGDIKYAKINGFEFFIHSYIIIKISLEKDSPSVGLIERIFNVDDEKIFYLKIFKIQQKIRHLNCLQIEPTDDYIYMKYDEILYKQINFSIIKDNTIFLPARYYYEIIV